MADNNTPQQRSGQDWFEDTDSERGRMSQSPLHNNAVTDSMRGEYGNTGGTGRGETGAGNNNMEGSVQPTGTSGKRSMNA